MTLIPPSSPTHCPDSQEAGSTLHARDTFRLRLLHSGQWALWDSTGTLLGFLEQDGFCGEEGFEARLLSATSHLRLLADQARLNREAEAFRLARLADEAQALRELEIEI